MHENADGDGPYIEHLVGVDAVGSDNLCHARPCSMVN
jgi:hypothetical protein